MLDIGFRAARRLLTDIRKKRIGCLEPHGRSMRVHADGPPGYA